jgi:hypothetical protein
MTDAHGRSVVSSTLTMVTCLALGLLTGGVLVIGMAFVSFWKSLSPSDFQAWFASHSHLRLIEALLAAGGPPTPRY